MNYDGFMHLGLEGALDCRGVIFAIISRPAKRAAFRLTAPAWNPIERALRGSGHCHQCQGTVHGNSVSVG
ncbi:hypothetical protein CEXT_416381 [Caerostris extrusa]|uniref:Uncharacterized protein n=1 Tax=Caerostris extrusa TaxID=172846 RepID=A0AAV4XFR8_CAEEX|nr:hypothetical protein CEXT_416381 [Caerostris extrusa]